MPFKEDHFLQARFWVLQIWNPLKSAVQPYAMLCRTDGLKCMMIVECTLNLASECSHERSILNPWKTSSGQPVALGGFDVWLGGFGPVLIDTIIHPCFKHAVSHVARQFCHPQIQGPPQLSLVKKNGFLVQGFTSLHSERFLKIPRSPVCKCRFLFPFCDQRSVSLV